MSLIRWRRPNTVPTVLEEMDRAFDRLFRYPIMRALEGADADYGPAVDIYETEAELVVKAELPGVKKEDIDLTVDEERLVLRGESKQQTEVDEHGYHRRELRYGQFRRVVPLPTAVKREEITAAFENGVLTIRAPKAEEPEKGKKVEIK